MREITFPEEWGTAPPIDAKEFRMPGGVTLAGMLLEDGANLWVCVFKGGHRFMRAAGDAHLGGQEVQLHGEPEDEEREAVEAAWKLLLAIDMKAALSVSAELRRN